MENNLEKKKPGITMLYTWNEHNIVNQLYIQRKKFPVMLK